MSARHSPSVPVDDAVRLRMAVTRLARLLRANGEQGLTPTQYSVLAAVKREGPFSLQALGRAESLAPPTVTKVVDKLEGMGYVNRQTSSRDRRSVDVRITPAGVSALSAIKGKKDAWLDARIAQLDPQKRGNLREVIQVLEELGAPEPA